MATLEEMCKKRGKALVENFGMKATKTKGTESMEALMDYSEKGVKNKVGGTYKPRNNVEAD